MEIVSKDMNYNIICTTYKEYSAKYPSFSGNNDLVCLKPSQVFYIDYNYDEENYQKTLQDFNDYLSVYLEDNQVSFLLLSEVMQDSLLNRKKDFVMEEHKYANSLTYHKKGSFSFNDNKIAKYVHFNIINYSISMDLLSFLFDNRQRVFIIKSDNEIDLDNDIQINSNYTKNQYDYIDFFSLYNNIKKVFILYGGFDFGQLALIKFQR